MKENRCFFEQKSVFWFSPSVTPAADNDQSHGSPSQNGPVSASEPHPANTHDSSDNDDDSGTEDEALRKEMNRLREK